MPSQLHFIGDTRPLTVDEDPAQVQDRLGSGGRLGSSSRTVVELHHGGQAIYVNPGAITFFAADSPRDEAPETGLRIGGPGFGRP
jgi:hypothetical protein